MRIRTGLIVSNSLLIGLLIFCIVAINIFYIQRLMVNDTSFYAQQTIGQMCEMIDNELSRIEYVSRNTFFFPDNQKIMLRKKSAMVSDEESDWDLYQQRVELDRIFNSIILAEPKIYSLAIYFDEQNYYGFHYFGNYFYENNLQTSDGWPIVSKFEQIGDIHNNMMWVPSHDVRENANLVTLLRSVVNTSSMTRIGILTLNIRAEHLGGILEKQKFGKTGELFLVDAGGNVVAGNEYALRDAASNELLEGIVTGDRNNYVDRSEGKPLFISHGLSDESGFRLVGIVPLEELNGAIIENQSIIILIGFIGLSVSIFMSLLLAKLITRPIHSLQSAMKEVEKGQLIVDLRESSFLETRELNRGFQIMLQNLRQLLTQVYDEELRRKDAEFKALKAQINPHFLYNTLETINYMLIINGQDEVSELVVALADIMRYNLKKNKDTVTLTEDVSHIRNYLIIQKARFGDKLRYSIDLVPETRNCYILNFILQPIVENALVHGIEMKSGVGELALSSSLDGDCLRIAVEDNGIGMTPEQARDVLLDIGNEEVLVHKNHTKLGISNVNRRIKLFYGNQYGLEIQSSVDAGTKVTVRLPVVYSDETTGNGKSLQS